MTDLIATLEGLTGPSRDADYRIEKVLVRPDEFPNVEMWPPFMAGSKFEKSIPAYTASLDAAIALIERVMPGWLWGVTQGDMGEELAVEFQGNVWPNAQPFSAADEQFGFHAQPAIALLIALLRAKEAEDGR